MGVSYASHLKAGDQIAEHIRLFAPVGMDVEGTVWDAIHAYEGRVAVKVFDAEPKPVTAAVVEAGTTDAGQPFVVCALDAAKELVVTKKKSIIPMSYEHLHEMLSCRPPMKRNWFPVFAAAAVAFVGALWGAGVI